MLRLQKRLALGIALVALQAAAFAVVFRSALAFVFRSVGATDVVAAVTHAPPWARVGLPTLGGTLAGLCALVASRSASGGGVGDVMEAVVLGRVHLSMRSTLLKSLASWLAIASGGSIGREGPLIQFGGASGEWIARRLRLEDDAARVLIAAGTAAGFAAAYNTPFAAVLFVLEIVTGVVVLETLVPVLVATVVAAAATRLVVGEGPVYGQRAFRLEAPVELIAFLGLGIVAALGAQVFMRTLSFAEKRFRVLPLPWRPALGGLLAGLVLLVVPEVAGNGYEPLNRLIDAQFAVPFVALLLLGKIAATTSSVSSGSPGGVFTPTLLVGGAIGFLYASALSRVPIHVGPAAGYALVGMAAATAATTHAPLMAAIMVFELSGDYAIALPLVLATAVATALSRKLRPESVYTAELARRGIGWEMTMEGRKLRRSASSEA